MASIQKQTKTDQQKAMEFATGSAPQPVQSKISGFASPPDEDAKSPKKRPRPVCEVNTTLCAPTLKRFKSVVPPPLAKKGRAGKRSFNTKAKIISLLDFDVEKDIRFHQLYKSSKMRTVTISPPSIKDPKTRIPVYIQLSGGGRIPFAVEASPHGTYSLNFDMNNEDEAQALKALDQAILDLAMKNRKLWWPDENLSSSVIKDRYRPIVKDGKEKDDGSTWNSSASAKIPINLNTGEPNAIKLNGKTKVCRLLDHDGAIVSMYDLHQRSWDKIIIAIGGLYFSSDHKWGVGPKTLSVVKLQRDFEAEADCQTIEFLEDGELCETDIDDRGCPSQTGILAQDPSLIDY